MKKKRLKLEELKVKSFVTLENNDLSETIKGGAVNAGDTLVPIDKPGKSDFGPACGPTPGTWCYVCPVDPPFDR